MQSLKYLFIEIFGLKGDQSCRRLFKLACLLYYMLVYCTNINPSTCSCQSCRANYLVSNPRAIQSNISATSPQYRQHQMMAVCVSRIYMIIFFPCRYSRKKQVLLAYSELAEKSPGQRCVVLNKYSF